MSQNVETGTNARWLYWGLAGLLTLVWLATLASRPLFNPDEGRYAEIPREMLSGGDWIIPHLNGLDYIGSSRRCSIGQLRATHRLFGVSEFSARLYTGTDGARDSGRDRIPGGRGFGATVLAGARPRSSPACSCLLSWDSS